MSAGPLLQREGLEAALDAGPLRASDAEDNEDKVDGSNAQMFY